MAIAKLAGGIVHNLPSDMRMAIASSPKALVTWEDITPLARNEWICWTITVKQEKTRKHHVKRTVNELARGKRRPCCWIGCIHRTDKAISPSVQWVLNKQKSKK